jgi:hypothetical protein
MRKRGEQQMPAKGWSQPRLDMKIQPERKQPPKPAPDKPLNEQHSPARERGTQHVLPFEAPANEHPMAKIARMTYDPKNRGFFEDRAADNRPYPATTPATRQKAMTDLTSHYQRAHGMDSNESFQAERAVRKRKLRKT